VPSDVVHGDLRSHIFTGDFNFKRDHCATPCSVPDDSALIIETSDSEKH
jgi:hypothetical protein